MLIYIVLTILLLALLTQYGFAFSVKCNMKRLMAGLLISGSLQADSAFASSLVDDFTPTKILSAKSGYDQETGEWTAPVDEDWQTTWKKRAEKASKMSPDEIKMAARGARKLTPEELANESKAGKKRRAMAACRTSDYQKTLKIKEIDCVNKVLKTGEVDFILDILDK